MYCGIHRRNNSWCKRFRRNSEPDKAKGKSEHVRGEKEEAVTEALIRQRVGDYTKAVGAKEIDANTQFLPGTVGAIGLEASAGR